MSVLCRGDVEGVAGCARGIGDEGFELLGVGLSVGVPVGARRIKSVAGGPLVLGLGLGEDRCGAPGWCVGPSAAAFAEVVAAHFPADEGDPLEAFIGSGSSGRGDLARRHREIRVELTGGHAARDL